MLETSTDIKGKSVEDTYKQLSLEEQIFLRPDTYIGSVEPVDTQMWVVEDPASLTDIKIRRRDVRYVPGFIKLFDEVLTNASDHKQRAGTNVKTIRVNVDKDFKFAVWNDGTGIPVQMHKDANCYVPELIFGRLLTGSNYDDSQERFGGGRNGFGAKLANRFSTHFLVQTSDGKLEYTQQFTENMMRAHEPIIEKAVKSEPQYTRITYKPDFTRLPVAGLEDDTMRIIVKRVLDIAAYNPDLRVYFNDVLLPVNNLKDYAAMHLEPGAEMFYEKLNDRFDVVFAESYTDSFEQVSVVNGISTHRGGAHVDVIANQMVMALREQLTKGNKKLNIRPNDIKSKLFMFLTAKVSNPQFDTQTKEYLVTKMTEPVLKGAQVSEKLVKQVMKSEIVATILNYIALREQAELGKLNKTKSTNVKIPKLQDADRAGTKDGYKCALFLTEGDSAASGCISGLSVVGRDHYGVFPLKGKPLNVRDAAVTKIKENEEINAIITALGLVIGKKYTDVSELRYGKVVIMSDADNDGTHIKGLLINLFHTFWPELLKMNYMYEFVTPILKARKGKETLSFYNLDQYKEWKAKDPVGYKVKYYKGLGTIMSDEMKDLFREVDKHLIPFQWSNVSEDDTIDKVFRKKRADDRKDWLLNYQGEVIPDKFGKPNPLQQFFNSEFIQFSMADNVRSIPQMMDGLKPSQRKVLYTAIKRNLREELKVAQLAGAVAETSAYHHGELSLGEAIVGMAQDFVGANNVNLLEPKGQFGTRLQGGSDAASTRYIFTHLVPLTRLIFRPEDDAILNYLEDDGESIEPDFYLPIVPMALVNGTDGIGTGWSTSIPKFDIRGLVKILEHKLAGGSRKYQLRPQYRGFEGTIEQENDKWVSTGTATVGAKNTVHITELPINMWTEKYIEILDGLVDAKLIRSFKNNSSDKKVDITLNMLKDGDGMTPALLNKLKLKTTLHTTNMHMFKGVKIEKYDTPEAILEDFFSERLKYYAVRKEHQLSVLKQQYSRNANIFKYLALAAQGKLNVMNRPEADIIQDLDDLKLARIDGSFDYLRDLPTRSYSKERLQQAKDAMEKRKAEHEELKGKTNEELWLADLQELKAALVKHK